jgi:hypothetical protein
MVDGKWPKHDSLSSAVENLPAIDESYPVYSVSYTDHLQFSPGL